MDYSAAERQVREYLGTFFGQHNDDRFVYHNREHTERVVAAAREIGAYYQLSERDLFVVTTAAWFHDIGYFLEPGNHEQRGSDEAARFLESISADKDVIDDVRGCILATQMPQKPQGLLQQIVCDADLFHLGTSHFSERNKLMRRECEALKKCPEDKNSWRKGTIRLLESHQYHTDYARNLLTKRKMENLDKLKGKEHEKELLKENPATISSKKDSKDDKPGRGVETMFRVTSNNHQRLSDMADNKAHIMITTTSIIISVLLSVLFRKLEEYPHLTIPALLLLATCVTTMVFSILATRPNIPPGTFTETDIQSKSVNLLFFGNFYNMTLDDYAAGMGKVMNDRDFLYGSLIRDIYSQGVVLGRKYKLLRVGYNIFMFGIIVSVLAFVIASLFFGNGK